MEPTIGARIRQLREAKQLSVADFAKAAGVKPSAVYGLESGANKPSLETVGALRESFPGLNTEWLQFGEGEMFGRTLAAVAHAHAPNVARTTLSIAQPTREEWAALQEENRQLREQLAVKTGTLTAVEEDRQWLRTELIKKPEASADAASLTETVDAIANDYWSPKPHKEIEGFRSASQRLRIA